MEVKPTQPKQQRSKPMGVDGGFLATTGLLLVAGVAIADLVVGDRPLSGELPPAASPGHLARSAVLAVASIALAIGLRRLAMTTLGSRPSVRRPSPMQMVAVAAGAAPGLAAAALIVISPDTLTSLVREDGPIEWASAGLAFLAGAFYLAAVVRSARRPRPEPSATSRGAPIMTSLALMAAAGAALLLGLEEISWFQRVLDVESPEFMLNRNGQQELNLHNLATGATGNAYFVGGFLWCIAIPHLLADRRLPGALASLEPLVPSRTVLLATATSVAIVYEMWNILWIQLTFWLTLAILVSGGSDGPSRRTERALAVVLVVVLAVHLLAGDAMVRSWDDTEVRELVIPFGLALAGAETVARVGRTTPSA